MKILVPVTYVRMPWHDLGRYILTSRVWLIRLGKHLVGVQHPRLGRSYTRRIHDATFLPGHLIAVRCIAALSGESTL